MSKTICTSGKVGNSTFVVFRDGVKTSGEVKVGDIHFHYNDEDANKVRTCVSRTIDEIDFKRKYW